jgi:hypothetical protein
MALGLCLPDRFRMWEDSGMWKRLATTIQFILNPAASADKIWARVMKIALYLVMVPSALQDYLPAWLQGWSAPTSFPGRLAVIFGELYTWLHSPSLHKSCIGPRFVLDYMRVVSYY